jgi:D-lactate dehydrogenase (cytochrome)
MFYLFRLEGISVIEKKEKTAVLPYLEDASNISGGFAEQVVIPKTPVEAAEVLKEASATNTPVTISGGGTGTAGGRIPFGGTILSCELFRQLEITAVDKEPVALVGAGVLIQDLKAAADTKGFFYPYDPTEQTAFTGGTIATNASGARSLKYGSTRNFVRSLDIVLADGNTATITRGQYRARGHTFDVVLNDKRYIIPIPRYSMPKVKKHSAGYFAAADMDLVDLFIGQEGTLGLVTGAELKLVKKPFDIFSCFAFFKDDLKSCNFAVEASHSKALSVEYLDINSLKLLKEIYANIPSWAQSCIFFEQEIEAHEDEAVFSFWSELLEEYEVDINNTWVAMTAAERKDFQQRRHKVPEKINDIVRQNKMPKVSTDLAVPPQNLTEMMAYYHQRLKKTAMPYFIFGHIGDAHLHTNLIPQSETDLAKAKEAAGDLVKKSIELGGTISAEHGIGKTKREFLKMLYGEEGIKEMAQTKRALDPKMILGRGTIIAEKYLQKE